MPASNPINKCQLCHQNRDLTFHHLIPRKLHRRNAFKRRYKRSELNAGIYICQLCHRGLHRLYDEMTLGKHFGKQEQLVSILIAYNY